MSSNYLKPASHRADVPHEQTWDIEALYPNREAWQQEAQLLENQLQHFASHHGKLQTATGLLAYLNVYDEARLLLMRLRSYTLMSTSVDNTDIEAVKLTEQVRVLDAKLGHAHAFFLPEFFAIPEEDLKTWMTTPEFATQRVRLERMLRRKPHTLNSELESVLSGLKIPFGSSNTIHPTLANMDLKFGTANNEVITQGNIGRLVSHPERSVRRQAWENYADAHLALQHSQASMYLTNVRQNVFLARTRHYPDAIRATLAPDNIPNEVISTLLETYRANATIWHRYWEVRRRWLNLKELREYDVKAALVSPSQISIQQAISWITEGMAPLGKEYTDVMTKGLTTERWTDYANNIGKRQGAYSAGMARVKPYIFMTWNHNMGSYSTLAHEIGHSMHSYLADEEHPISVPRYTLFHAEVASNFNQAMVRGHLLKKARNCGNVLFEVELLEEALGNFHRYFFIMPTLAAFEWECYKNIDAGKSMSAPDLIDLMADLQAEGYGSGVVMDRQRSGSLWMQFSTHLYANFYAYQYATGISAAHHLVKQFDHDALAAQKRYLAFLKSGGSLDPIDALAKAKVDILNPATIEDTFQVLKGHIDRLEELLEIVQNRREEEKKHQEE